MEQNNQQQNTVQTPPKTDNAAPVAPAKKSKASLFLLVGLPLLIGAVLMSYMALNNERNTIRSRASYEAPQQTSQMKQENPMRNQDELQKEINKIDIPDITNDLDHIEKAINAL